jgi:hypothetical protein
VTTATVIAAGGAAALFATSIILFRFAWRP